MAVYVRDPSGTPDPNYNPSGEEQRDLSATGTTSGAAAGISIQAGVSVQLITTTTNNTGVILPQGAPVGQVVEVYWVSGANAPVVYQPGGGGAITLGTVNKGIRFRHVGNDLFVAVGA